MKMKDEIMTQEDRQLLLADLCARLPYYPIVSVAYNYSDKGIVWESDILGIKLLLEIEENDSWEYIKPYLRPMSSMTEDEKKEYAKLLFADLGGVCEDYYKALDYLHKKHINYRLPPHLFIEITEENNPYE